MRNLWSLKEWRKLTTEEWTNKYDNILQAAEEIDIFMCA